MKAAQLSKKAFGRQKRLSVVKKGREGWHGRLVGAADIKKGRCLSKKAVSRQKRLWRLRWRSSTCRGHQKRPSAVKKGREGCHGTMCWHKDIAKFQFLMKTIPNDCLYIQYERRMANLHFLCSFNGILIDLTMTLLAKKICFCQFYVAKF
jgi:hypothetical protein